MVFEDSSFPNARVTKHRIRRRDQWAAQARVVLTPAYALAIWAESRLESVIDLRFPRNLDEVHANPKRLFMLLQASGAIPLSAALVSITRRGRMINEPDKDHTAAALTVMSESHGQTSELPVFIKFQSGRGMPLLLQAVRAAVEPGIAREVDFYRFLASTTPVRAPQAYFVDSLTAVNRVCLVLEHIDGYNLADWRGCPPSGIRAILGNIARVNSAFASRTADDVRSAWIPARTGLDFASFVATLAGTPPAWYTELWNALVSYFRDRPVTLVHGDCRPGNMLFVDNGELQRHQHPENAGDANPWPDEGSASPNVVFADWEAVNAAPLLWDFTYCTIIGLRSADRREHQSRLLQEFLDALRVGGTSDALCDLQRCQREVELLTLVLYYIAALVASKKYWDKQGNTIEDYRAWSARILDAVRAVDAGQSAQALGVSADLIERLQREAAFAART
jgi:hypothetical protein